MDDASGPVGRPILPVDTVQGAWAELERYVLECQRAKHPYDRPRHVPGDALIVALLDVRRRLERRFDQ